MCSARNAGHGICSRDTSATGMTPSRSASTRIVWLEHPPSSVLTWAKRILTYKSCFYQCFAGATLPTTTLWGLAKGGLGRAAPKYLQSTTCLTLYNAANAEIWSAQSADNKLTATPTVSNQRPGQNWRSIRLSLWRCTTTGRVPTAKKLWKGFQAAAK